MSEPMLTVDLVGNKLCGVLGRLDLAIAIMRQHEQYAALDDAIEARAAALELAEACREARRAFRAAST